MRLTRSTLAAAAAVGLVAAGGSAFTAGNTTTPFSSAGQASTVTTGFAVSALDYVLATGSDATGDQLASVAFTLTATAGQNAATEARVQLEDDQVYWNCGTPATTGLVSVFSCTTTGQLVSAMDTLNIVAVSN